MYQLTGNCGKVPDLALGLSRMCICIGCAAAFRRLDVEKLVFLHVQRITPADHDVTGTVES